MEMKPEPTSDPELWKAMPDQMCEPAIIPIKAKFVPEMESDQVCDQSLCPFLWEF